MSDTDSLLSAPKSQSASIPYADWLRTQLLDLKQQVAEQGQELRRLRGLVNSLSHSDSPHERTFSLQKRDVFSSVIFPGGQRMATGSLDSNARIVIWDLVRNYDVRVLNDHKGTVFALAVSPNGKLLASGSADKTIHIYGTSSLDRKAVVEGAHSDTVHCLDFDEEPTLLASGGWDGKIAIHSLEDFSTQATFQAHTGEVHGVKFIGGERLASVGTDGMLRVWSISDILSSKTGDAPPAPAAEARATKGPLHTLLAAAGGQVLFVAGPPGERIKSYHLSDGKLSPIVDVPALHGGHIHALQLLPMTKDVVPDSPSKSEKSAPPSEDPSAVELRRAMKGYLLLSGASDGTIRSFALRSSDVSGNPMWEPLQVLQAHENTVTALAVQRRQDGEVKEENPGVRHRVERFVSVSKDARVSVWSVSKFRALLTNSVAESSFTEQGDDVSGEDGDYNMPTSPYIGE